MIKLKEKLIYQEAYSLFAVTLGKSWWNKLNTPLTVKGDFKNSINIGQTD